MRDVVLDLGAADHTVARHLASLAAAAGVPVARAVPPGARVHVDLTDRVLGPDLTAAEAAADVLLDATVGRDLVLGLHDLPGDDAWSRRRRPLYDRLAAAARTVVVCSAVEAARVHGCDDVRVVPLPVHAGPRAPVAARAESVTAIGYVWPGRGHDELLAVLPAGVPLVWVGTAAPGHADEAARLAAHPCVTLTGWVDDARREALLSAATVPVAPNRAVSASASICSWWSVGRRPLVPVTPYARELVARDPGALLLYDDLVPALAAALADPASTYLPAGLTPGIDLATAARLRFA